jgi:TRAP-type C4-dicarboxylate transport system substrate-binding protein
MANMTSGNTECAITGTMSGNTMGLHEATKYIHTLPVNWGVAIFGANQAAWNALNPELRALLSRELPKLEAAIWSESERETAEGLACNKGAASCNMGKRGQMVEVHLSTPDERQRKEIFLTTVLPHWLQRCNGRCEDLWNQTIGTVTGIKAEVAK